MKIEFHNIKSNDIDLGGDINLQMISPLVCRCSTIVSLQEVENLLIAKRTCPGKKNVENAMVLNFDLIHHGSLNTRERSNTEFQMCM